MIDNYLISIVINYFSHSVFIPHRLQKVIKNPLLHALQMRGFSSMNPMNENLFYPRTKNYFPK